MLFRSNDYKISLFPDTTYRELNKAAQRSITAPDRIGEGKTWVYQRDTMVERGDNSGVHQYGPAEHFTHIISDKPSPKDKYVAYAINIPDYELADDVYNINVTSPTGQQETYKILINPEHLRQTLERKSLTAVQKSQCETSNLFLLREFLVRRRGKWLREGFVYTHNDNVQTQIYFS